MTTKEYFGTKRVEAWPQARIAGTSPPIMVDDGKEQAGDELGYAVRYADGYTSWSPKAAFDAAYQPITAMSFGHAIAAMKAGERVARAGWNGKGMWIALTLGSSILPSLARNGAAKLLAVGRTEAIDIGPHIDMRAADGSLVIGWLASQTDMLADDWMIVAKE